MQHPWSSSAHGHGQAPSRVAAVSVESLHLPGKEVGRVGSWWQWGRGAAARVSFPARLVDIRHLHRREHPDDPAAHMVEELVAAATALAQAVVAYDGKGREKVL